MNIEIKTKLNHSDDVDGFSPKFVMPASPRELTSNQCYSRSNIRDPLSYELKIYKPHETSPKIYEVDRLNF